MLKNLRINTLKSKIKPVAKRAGVKKVGFKEMRGLISSHISWV